MRVTSTTAVAATTASSPSSRLGQRILDHVAKTGQLQGVIEFPNSVNGVRALHDDIVGFREQFKKAGITISTPTLVQSTTRGVFAQVDFTVADTTPPGARAAADALGIKSAGQLRAIASPIVDDKAIKLIKTIETLVTEKRSASGTLPWGQASSDTPHHVENTLRFVNRQLAPLFAEAGIRLKGDGIHQANGVVTAHLAYSVLPRPIVDDNAQQVRG